MRPRVGGFPPSATLEYMAEKAFWQAVNMYNFKGDLEAWSQAVADTLETPFDVEAAKVAHAEKVAPAIRALDQQYAKSVEAAPTIAVSNALDDIEEWLK